MTQDNSSAGSQPADERQDPGSALLSTVENFYETYKNSPPEMQRRLAAAYALAKPDQQAAIRQNLQDCAKADPQNALSVINSLRDNVLAVSQARQGGPPQADAGAAAPAANPTAGRAAPNAGTTPAVVAGSAAPAMMQGGGAPNVRAATSPQTAPPAQPTVRQDSGPQRLQLAEKPPPPSGDQTLADELGIDEIRNPVFGGRGRIFSAAGRQSPVATFTSDFLMLHPPQKPFTETGPSEDISIKVDKRGVLIDELNRPKHISGAKFRGQQLWYLGERKIGTLKHYAGWFDQKDVPHKLYVNNEALTTDIVFRLRNKTHDGEVSIFPDIKSE
jgi:hypothetical protein